MTHSSTTRSCLRTLIPISGVTLFLLSATGGCSVEAAPDDPTVESASTSEDSDAVCWGQQTFSGHGYRMLNIRDTQADHETWQQAVLRTRELARAAARTKAASSARNQCHDSVTLCHAAAGAPEYAGVGGADECERMGEDWLCEVSAQVVCKYSFFGKDPCGGECGSDSVCLDGVCEYVGACVNVECPSGWACSDGLCEPSDPCAGVVCPPGSTCTDGLCSPTDPCTGVACPIGSSCIGGVCQTLDPCANVLCGFGEACVQGQCVSSGCSSDFDCPPGQHCWGSPGAGFCAPEGQSCIQDGFCDADENCLCEAACCGGGGTVPGTGPGGTCGWDGGGPISYNDCYACGGSVIWSSDYGAYVCEGATAS